VRGHAQRAGRLAADDHGLVLVGELPGLEAQAGVEALEARDVHEGPDAPLLVAHEQQRGLGEVARARGQGAQEPERQHVAALHVDRARAQQLLAVARQRAVLLVGDDRVEVAEQQ
jgi:hypothetical protein